MYKHKIRTLGGDYWGGYTNKPICTFEGFSMVSMRDGYNKETYTLQNSNYVLLCEWERSFISI
jgi:hypothetical protein